MTCPPCNQNCNEGRDCPARSESQEPVAWPCVIAEADFSQNTVTLTMQCTDYKISAGKHWLFTTPPQRTWVDLTEDEAFVCQGRNYFETYRNIGAKLKQKNGFAEEKNN